jgi:hypothetical protein
MAERLRGGDASTRHRGAAAVAFRRERTACVIVLALGLVGSKLYGGMS